MTGTDKRKTVCILDSNVWLYAFIRTQDPIKSRIAKSVIQNNELSIAVSTQIINEVCVNLIKKANLPEGKIKGLIDSFYKDYDVIGMEYEILLKASEIREQNKFSFWDSLIFASGLWLGADIVYSEDMQDGFTIEKTRIVNPFKYRD